MLQNRLRNKRISSLFVLRFICVFMIVAIHYPIAHTGWLEPILRTAVPLFLMTSGYFLYSENRTSTRKHIRRSLIKMLWIIIYANMMFGCLKAIAYATGTADPLVLNSIEAWLKLIFVGNTIVEYFWYLTAYIEALLVFLLLFQFRKERILTFLTPLFLLLGLLLGKYSLLLGLNNSPPLWIGRNFLTIALPCIYLGYLLHRHEQLLLTHIGRHFPFYMLVTLILALAEGILLQGAAWRMGDLFVSSTPLAILVFLLCLKHKDFGAGTPFDRMGEMHALNIYIYQAFVAGVITTLSLRLLSLNITPYAAPLIFLSCLFFSEIINQTHRALRR